MKLRLLALLVVGLLTAGSASVLAQSSQDYTHLQTTKFLKQYPEHAAAFTRSATRGMMACSDPIVIEKMARFNNVGTSATPKALPSAGTSSPKSKSSPVAPQKPTRTSREVAPPSLIPPPPVKPVKGK